MVARENKNLETRELNNYLVTRAMLQDIKVRIKL
jgi:hypothetical protein